ncbi:hypothetical protein LZZ85_17990 [Terrimonas sp. NA20]|uniref:Uncharacterized protein n=1 Tax=Terrimonas ginsenosidimutans TaxID=2908004 RepID=A0ABS9KVC5_9BACT|nr:hypothetical protein [Terrimonas ginsenosidimutans]MCG2616194.1 hypothetical protein [Terrimonas ginsenosidimutans]
MSTRISLAAVTSWLILTACSIGGGANKDLATGLTYRYTHCSVRDVQLVDVRNIPFTSNVVHMGTTFLVSASGIQNFTLTDGKAYPGCELTLKDKLGKTIAQVPDLLESTAKDGIITPGPLDLAATITMSPPLTSGETYRITARFFDKKEVKREVVAEVVVQLVD